MFFFIKSESEFWAEPRSKGSRNIVWKIIESHLKCFLEISIFSITYFNRNHLPTLYKAEVINIIEKKQMFNYVRLTGNLFCLSCWVLPCQSRRVTIPTPLFHCQASRHGSILRKVCPLLDGLWVLHCVKGRI